MCGHGMHHHHYEYCCCYGYCCCGEPRPREWALGFHRRFSTREERIARLEEYLKELQAELQAVQEYLAELKGSR